MLVEELRRGAGTPWIRTVAVLAVAQVVSELGFSFALPFMSLYLQELGVTDVAEVGLWSGLTVAAFAIAMALMAPIWGLVADRFGYRRMLQRALFGAGLATALVALVQTPEQLLALRLIQGASAGVETAIVTLVSVTVPRRHLPTVLGLLQAAVFLGLALGPLLGGAFADQFGLRAAFACTGVILCLTGLLISALVREPERRACRVEAGVVRPEVGGRQRLFTPEVIAVITLAALARFALTAPLPLLPLYVQQLVESPDGLATTVGLVLAAAGFASTVSALLISRLYRWLGLRPILLGCLVLATVLTALHAAVGSIWQLLVLRTALGLAQGGIGPAIQALLVNVTPPGRRGAAFGLLTTANAAGNGGGPVVVSVIAAAFGLPAVFLTTATVPAIGAWLVTRLTPRSPAATGARTGSSVPQIPPRTHGQAALRHDGTRVAGG